jgi:ATP-dependent RNA helicase SUPV3L1/SUV3
VLDKRAVDTELKALSQAERRTLKSLGVRIGAFSLFLPAVLRAEAIACARALNPGGWRGALTTLEPGCPSPSPRPRPVGQRPARWSASVMPVEMLENGWTPCCARAEAWVGWC